MPLLVLRVSARRAGTGQSGCRDGPGCSALLEGRREAGWEVGLAWPADGKPPARGEDQRGREESLELPAGLLHSVVSTCRPCFQSRPVARGLETLASTGVFPHVPAVVVGTLPEQGKGRGCLRGASGRQLTARSL